MATTHLKGGFAMKRIGSSLLGLGAFALTVLWLVTAAPVAAFSTSHILVTTTADEYDKFGTGLGCSLREAITVANTDAPFGGCSKDGATDVIVLDAAAYELARNGPADNS